ncbi:ATP-grasp domain-containing protein [Actinomadura sp. 9N407]|uniref:ATP-grasp domain-containing protein n=1 Tax=Actinomadura sp. 9N407 TaxID=3375154 RepID=UPI00378F46AE
MPMLVLSPRYTADSRTLRTAAVTAGWGVERLGGWRAPDRLRGRDVVLYGEPLFVEIIATRLGLAMLDAPAGWLPDLPERHLGRRIATSTLGEARAMAGPVFVKPADGRKGFEGAVYRNGTGLPPAGAQPDDTPVLVADPVTWEVEFRCFVLEGRVVTLSPYLREGELAQGEDGQWHSSPDETSQARDYAAQVLAEIDVPAGIVIDVGRIAGHGWAVVEANSAWGAGVYGCDPRRVLDVLARACVPRDRLTDGDAPWAVETLELDG